MNGYCSHLAAVFAVYEIETNKRIGNLMEYDYFISDKEECSHYWFKNGEKEYIFITGYDFGY